MLFARGRKHVRRDWSATIERLNRSRSGELRIRMGSPGSAQVTRCRLLEQWSNLRVRTRGAMLYIALG
jgi:hypothetical protein